MGMEKYPGSEKGSLSVFLLKECSTLVRREDKENDSVLDITAFINKGGDKGPLF